REAMPMPERIQRRPVRRRDEEPDGNEKEFDPQDDEDEPPRRSSRGVKSATASTRRAPRSDDGDEAPKSKAVRSGWGGARRVKEASGDFPENLELSDEQILIKFLEDAPF